MYEKSKISALLVLLALFATAAGCTGNSAGATVSEEPSIVIRDAEISQAGLLKHVEELTSEKYKGRMVGTEGNRLAEDYIYDYFKKLGLESPPGIKDYKQFYKQGVILLEEKPLLQIIDKTGKISADFVYAEDFVLRRLSWQPEKVDMTAPLLLLENADMLPDKDTDLKGKLLLIPEKLDFLVGNPDFPADPAVKYNAGAVICEFNLEDNEHGLKYLRVTPLQESWQQAEYKPFIFAGQSTFSHLAEAAKAGSRVHFEGKASPMTYVDAANVVGIIPGTDPELEYSYIVIGAHFDHVGDNLNGTYNGGALDNASGPAVMLELARIIKESGIAPRRPIAFIGFNGESSGFVGSRHFVANPLFPLGKAIMINLDMVGASADVKLSLCKAPNTGSAMNAPRDELSGFAKELGIDHEVGFQGGSDHVSFAEQGIPSVMIYCPDYGSGYHSPHDTMEGISGDRLEEVVRLVLYYLEENAF